MYNVSVSSLGDATHDVLGDWDRLADQVSANASLYPDWITTTLKTHGKYAQCQLACIRSGSNLVAAIPFVVSRQTMAKLPVNVFDLASNIVCYHNEVVSALPPGDTLAELVKIASAASADVIRLAAVSEDAPIARELASRTPPGATSFQRAGESSPYMPLPDSWEALLGQKNKKFRYKARKRSELLDEHSDNEMAWLDSTDEIEGFLEAVRDIEENSWKKEAGLAIFDRPAERRYHEALLPMLLERRMLLANVLTVGNRPAAYSLACLRNGWCGQMKTSFNTEFADLSPGAVVVDETIKKAIELGAVEFDFLGDKDAYKLTWTKQVRDHATHSLFMKNRWKGRVLAAVERYLR